MTMLVGVTVEEVKELVERLVASHGQALSQLVLRHAVDGKDIDIDACQIVAMLALNQRGAAIDNLAKAAREGGTRLDAQRFKGLGQPLVSMGHEAVVVGARHADVHIVIPRNETLVPHGTQHGASPTIVADVVFAANTIYSKQDLQDVSVQRFYIVRSHNRQLFLMK